MWKEGNIDGYRYQIKVYDEASDEYGINGGRISKLWMQKDGKEVANYDRGWDRRPTGKAKAAYKKLLAMYN